jgi:mycothiol system anti-sigma-R factor
MTDQHEQHDKHPRPTTEADCTRALVEIYTFLDGELTDERRERITRHLDDCSPCLEIFDFEAELRLVVQHRCRDQAPEHLRVRIQSTLRALAARDDLAE